MRLKKSTISIAGLALLITGIAALFPLPAHGDDPPPDLIIIRTRDDSSGTAHGTDFILARRLMSQGAYISAADLLEDLYVRNPGSRDIAGMLLNCYMELKAYSKAELMLKRELETNPFDFAYNDRLLEVYLKSGVDSSINAHIETFLERFPGDKDTYLSLLTRLIREGYEDRAMELIKRARTEFESNRLFAMEAASILEVKGAYYEAVMEYFRAMSGDSLLAPDVDKRLANLIRYPGAPPGIIDAVTDILDSIPGDKYVLRVLQEAYIMQNRHEEAFTTTIRLDSLNKNNGRELYNYMRQCRERKLFHQVIRMAQYIEQNCDETTPISEYRFYEAEALAGLGRHQEAIDAYRGIYDSFPTPRDKAVALLETGNVYRYHLLKFDSAHFYYDKVLSAFMLEPTYSLAGIEKAGLYLAEGRLDSAETAFNKLKGWINGDLYQELVSYNLAMIKFMKKDFSEADLAFRTLMAEFPRGFYVNDALILSLIIGESMMMNPEALSRYSEAVYYDYRQMPDSVIKRYNDVIEMGQTTLWGFVTYKLADYYTKLGDTLTALEAIADMESSNPDDYFYPYALKLKGEIFLKSDGQKDEAAAIFETLLRDFGEYPFAGEIRKRLKSTGSPTPAS